MTKAGDWRRFENAKAGDLLGAAFAGLAQEKPGAMTA